jgi:hypothetical protein
MDWMAGGELVASITVSSEQVPLYKKKNQLLHKDLFFFHCMIQYHIIPASTRIANLNLMSIVFGPFPSPGPVTNACEEFGKLNSKLR